jgi:hypothetical protein
MKQKFVKVRIHTDKGYVNGCIDISKVYSFRENPFDCNATIVYTQDQTFCVYMKFKEFCEKVGVI